MKRLLPLLLAAVCIAPLAAAPVVGVAPVDNDVALARSQALDDALLNAGLADGARIQAMEDSDGGRLAQASQLRPRSQPTGYRVLREWQASGLYHIEIEPTSAPAPAPATAAAAAPETAPAATTAVAPTPAPVCSDGYRRKLLVTPFRIRQPGQGSDIGQLQIGLQDALTSRLDDAGFAASRSGNDAPFTIDPGLADLRQQPEHVRRLARQHATQFVVAGVINDMSTEGERYTLSYGANDVRQGERKLGFIVPLLDFFEPGLKATPRTRYFDTDLLLFDGVSGALISRKRFTARAGGEVAMRGGTQFGSASFYDTGYGAAVAQQLDEMVRTTQAELGCLPFSARVVRAERGQVYLDAGSMAGLKPGDRLQLYRLKPGSMPVDGLIEGDALRLGMPEQLAGTLVITQTQPQFSIAQSEGGTADVGDYARGTSRPRR
ncbi:flagella assembly protein FlgT middle domain-containing protein [Chitinolyticbacter meiyuanensis]|uniref:flagella assembly protein FlgT middle domain-containing protein n=1 Tax=Chitinolyticbacter meiyuanensis TaxID=682798 RepID=UPI0011E5D8E2|nr:flagella assembly protein FlgT middle domain-containing protein [Chitinolyticbacter meiyuanensis]